ncbi:MAG: diguanylate cyclase [Candidatus Omnitrophota bacterium]
MVFNKEKLLNIKSENDPHKVHTLMIVDDDDRNRQAMVSLFSSDYHIITAEDGQEAYGMIIGMENPQRISLVISDYQMPRMNGIQLFEKLLPLIPDTIRFILTGHDEKPVMLDAINKVKLDQFVTKPFDPEDLKLRVKRAIESLDYKNEAMALRKALEEMGISDPLTGIRNRRFLNESIGTHIAKVDRDYEGWVRGRRDSIPFESDLTFILLDIDGLKKVNDTYGRDVGDSMLIQVAEILKRYSRAADMLVRWGGSEFLIVTRSTPRYNVVNLVDRLHQVFEEHMFEIGPGKMIPLACSMGYASYPFLPTHYNEFNKDEVIGIAKAALSKAKASGVNEWVGLFATDKTQPENLFERIKSNIGALLESGELKALASFQ